jgi:hypothetical protein
MGRHAGVAIQGQRQARPAHWPPGRVMGQSQSASAFQRHLAQALHRCVAGTAAFPISRQQARGGGWQLNPAQASAPAFRRSRRLHCRCASNRRWRAAMPWHPRPARTGRRGEARLDRATPLPAPCPPRVRPCGCATRIKALSLRPSRLQGSQQRRQQRDHLPRQHKIHAPAQKQSRLKAQHQTPPHQLHGGAHLLWGQARYDGQQASFRIVFMFL